MALVSTCLNVQPRYVEASAPIRLPFGLFSVADVQESADPNFSRAIEWQPLACGPASIYPCPSCAANDGTAPDTQKTYNQGIPLSQAFPFTVYGSFWCSPVGSWDDAERRAREALLSGRERAVEGEFLAGTGHTGSLASTATNITPTPGTPLTRAEGIALLEQWIGANSTGLGTILGARRDVLLAATDHAVVHPTVGQDTLYTALNTPIAALGGYNGLTGPAATGTGNAWLYAVGSQIRVRRGGIFGTSREQSLNITNNNLQILAEQTYTVAYDCGAAAVLIQSV